MGRQQQVTAIGRFLQYPEPGCSRLFRQFASHGIYVRIGDLQRTMHAIAREEASHAAAGCADDGVRDGVPLRTLDRQLIVDAMPFLDEGDKAGLHAGKDAVLKDIGLPIGVRIVAMGVPMFIFAA